MHHFLDPQAQLFHIALTNAALFCRHLQSKLNTENQVTKPDGSLVTLADYGAQALINKHLAHATYHNIIPPTPLICEESAHDLQSQPALLKLLLQALHETNAWPNVTKDALIAAINWQDAHPNRTGKPMPETYITIDPIDGTKGFAAQRQYALCLARIHHNTITHATIACPNLPPRSQPFDTIDPQGIVMSLNLKDPAHPILTSPCTQPFTSPSAPLAPLPPRQSTLPPNPVITFSVEPSDSRKTKLQTLLNAIGSTAQPASLDSQAKYCVVARGDADCYFRPPRPNKEAVWDHAAGCALITAAGCITTDTIGQPLSFTHYRMDHNLGILGAPPDLHRKVLHALKSHHQTNESSKLPDAPKPTLGPF